MKKVPQPGYGTSRMNTEGRLGPQFICRTTSMTFPWTCKFSGLSM